MIKIIFVCHGNICRSVAAEYIAKKIIKERNIEHLYSIESKATSLEEIGNDIYPPMKYCLTRHNIQYQKHRASRINMRDVNESDYIYYMDNNNLNNLIRMFNDNDKFINITKYVDKYNYIEDPWYSDNFDKVVDQLIECINLIFDHLPNKISFSHLTIINQYILRGH